MLASLGKWWPVVVGLPVLVGGGVLHGLWTERWVQSPYLSEAAAKLEALPEDIGAWKGVAYEQDPEALALTGAAGHYSRTFTDPVTGEKVLVILLCGKPAQMVVHRPEDCYRAAGYDMAGPTVKVKVRPAESDEAEMLTGTFNRDDATGPTQLRIFWSWYGGHGQQWEAPDSPRFHFASEPVLYKLYVIRNLAGHNAPVAQDPAIRLLGELLPLLQRRLGS
jgi:hypothetical protein